MSSKIAAAVDHGFRYVFFVVAVDRAGNRERHPVDVTTRVARGAR